MQTNAYCNPDVLMRMVHAGSPDALDRLTRCYGERLLAAGRRYCRTRTEAEDAVQDTYVIVATRLDSFRGEGSLEGWLVRMVASACRRMARGRKNDPSLHLSDAEEPASSEPSPFAATCSGELGRLLQQALIELPRVDRLILLLAEADGWRAPEIAAELGLSAGAVRTRLSRLRGRMRAALSPALREDGKSS